MALYGIADLHLSFDQPKPMDIFGDHWFKHYEKIKEDWMSRVKADDTVLIPGDISWAMKLKDAMVDLEWIQELPGKKILIKGNHDYWWGSISKLNQLFESMIFLQNSFHPYQDYAICGTRGWICPNESRFTEQDEKIYLREVQRLRASLGQAHRAGYRNKIVMLHYPPTNDQLEPSLFTDLCQEFEVEQVVYGHLHGEDAYDAGLKGNYQGIQFNLISCDYLNFNLHCLLRE
ncbi:metallophosphoesterase [Alkaliphilus crotonatoxidans]